MALGALQIGWELKNGKGNLYGRDKNGDDINAQDGYGTDGDICERQVRNIRVKSEYRETGSSGWYVNPRHHIKIER